MERTKSFLALGIAFMTSGATFLAVGLSTHILALWALGPSLMGVGIVFLAVSKRSHNLRGTKSSGSQTPGSGA
ncbi:hypothetical protein PAGU2595_026620 [Lysobacter xanthus]